LEELIQTITKLDPAWIYLTIFVVAFIENIFPPAPSDIIVVFGGALAGMEQGNFVLAFLSGAFGGTLGFMVMYTLGKWFGHSILEKGKIKFIKLDDLHKFERWFQKWGFWLIVGNRFLSGTRAVVSFFAGVSELDFKRTIVLSLISSILWYAILVYAGYSLGQHWEQVGSLLKTYSIAVTITIVLIGTLSAIRYFYLRKRKNLK
jgi:membrane protein DedA with SNARE-associated domain